MKSIGARRPRRGTFSRELSAGPCPLEVETANPSVDIADLAAEVKARDEARFHRAEVKFAEGNASRRHLGEIPPAIPADWNRKPRRGPRQAPLRFSREATEWLARIEPRAMTNDGLSNFLGNGAVEEVPDRGVRIFDRLVPDPSENLVERRAADSRDRA